MFGKNEPSVKELGVFVTRPFTNLKKANEQLGGNFHGTGMSKGNKTHHNAMQDATTFMVAMEKKGSRIDHQLSSTHSKQVEENLLKIRSIVETIIFCGRQGMATVMIDLQIQIKIMETFWLCYSFVCNLEIKCCQTI